MTHELDYDQMVQLDAEDLAETGVKEAYESLMPRLRQYVRQPAPIEEVTDRDAPRYVVKCGAREFVIYSPELGNEYQSWGRATFALFTIINQQLGSSPYRFYAINGGNDLGGMFLTSAQAEAARESLARRTDWPYIPTAEEPWYGQFH
jgi:hypothetical protein